MMVYDTIFNKTDALFRVLQHKVMDIGYCCGRIKNTIGDNERDREDFNSLYERFELRCAMLGLNESGRCQLAKDERKKLFHEIIDNILMQMKARFDNFSDLDFLSLVDCEKFQGMSRHFDETRLEPVKIFKVFRLRKIKG